MSAPAASAAAADLGHILIAGGAGYIGSHCAHWLSQRGYRVIILDDLSSGHRAAAQAAGGQFIQGDIADAALLRDIFARQRVSAVLHFAAFIRVDQSVAAPAAYYRNNVGKTLTLLEEMLAADVKCFVFSSTAAVFGEAQYTPIDAAHPKQPVNPYGRGKLMIERVLADYERAYDLKYAILRYFNACGAHPQATLGELHDPETHLIPIALQAALGERDAFYLYGDDYDTADGTCQRDYVHVCDLAQAHHLALQKILQDGRSLACNLGNGAGFTVRQVLDAVRDVTQRDFPVIAAPRRAGDAPAIVADSGAAMTQLGWRPQYAALQDIVRHAWQWECSDTRRQWQNAKQSAPPAPMLK